MRATLKATEVKQLHATDVRSGRGSAFCACAKVTKLCTDIDPTSLADISLRLGEDVSLAEGFVHSSPKKPSHMSLLKDYLGILASADNPTPVGQASSFVSLNGSKVQVEFAIIKTRLRRRVIEAVTRERFGEDAVRIVKLLLDTGKMEEKLVGGYILR